MSPLTPKRTLRESGALALILVVWGVAAMVIGFEPTIRTGIQVAGLIMAGLYAVVRGRTLSADARAVYQSTDPEAILRDNFRALLPALAWFVLAAVAIGIEGLLDVALREFGLFAYPAATLAYLFAGTGVMTVLLYAVATGYATLASTRRPSSTSADD